MTSVPKFIQVPTPATRPANPTVSHGIPDQLSSEVEKSIEPPASVQQQCPFAIVSYWLGEQSFPRVRAIAMKVAAFSSSNADVERLFSETRAAYDFNQAAISTEHLNERTCVK